MSDIGGAASLGEMTVSYGADVSGLEAGSAKAKASIGSVADAAKFGFFANLGANAASSLLDIGKKALEAGVASIKMAGDFQEGMTTLVTGAGEAQSNLGLVSDGILKLAVDTATSTKQLTDGMYMIESAGYHGAAGLTILKTAAQGAKVGNADLGTVANVLTTILHDYHMAANQSAGAMNALTMTVASGKTHLQDLAFSMGSVLPLAAALGISFPQVAGAIAEMTNSGMSAQRASMELANTIRALSAPNSAAQKSMKEVGITAQELKDTLSTDGLTGAIQLVEQHVGNTFPANSVASVAAFKAIMGGAVGYNVSLMLGGKNMSDYENNVKNITSAMQSGKAGVTGWSLVQQDFNFKIAQGKEVLETLGIKIGTALIPVVSTLIGDVVPLITQFGNWLTTSGALTTITQDLSATIGVTATVLGTLVGWIVSFVGWMNQGSPAAILVRDALLGIGLAIAGIKIVQFGQDVFNMATGAIGNVKKIATTITDALGPAISKAKDMFTGSGGLQEAAATASQKAEDSIGGIANTVKTDVIPAEESIGTTMTGTVEKDVAEGAISAEGSISGIATTTGATAAEVEGKAASMSSSLGGVLGVIGLLLPAAQQVEQALGGIKGPNGQTVAQNNATARGSGIYLGPGYNFFGHASGGVIPPGQFGTAGEQGTELLYGGSSGISVLPAPQTASLFSSAYSPALMYGGNSGGGNEYHFHIELGGREIGYTMAKDSGFVDAIGTGVVKRVRQLGGLKR